MEKVQWTADQQKVIDLRNRNILVSAAAGSGKTAVLVERIITMITEGENPVDIDRLLIVTFTNAAAAEMRERIGKAIEKKLDEQPDNIHLQKQMTLLHSAQITTIHSFCLNVIHNHFNVIDLDPGFRVGDEAELRLIKSDVLGELLEKKYEEGEEGFLDFVESYSTGKSDAGLEDIVLQLHEFSMSYPWPIQWLEERRSSFHIMDEDSMEQTDWMQELKQYMQTVIRDLKQLNEKAANTCREEGGPYLYLDAIEEDAQIIHSLSQAETYNDYATILTEISWKRLSAKKDPRIFEGKKNFVKALRDQVKKAIQDLNKNYFFQPVEQMVEDIRGVEVVMNALIDLTIEFGQAYRAKKEEKYLVDFSDLEHFALNILVKQDANKQEEPSWVAIDLSEFYEEILIDEYQDSNMVQETILKHISKEKFGRPNLFMVGDVKQSIYKFRLARPELFMHKFNTYDLEESLYQRIDLHKNFRSRGVVLNFVNYIFKQIMTKELGNIEYNHEASLFVGAKFDETEKPVSTNSELILVTQEEETEVPLKELEARAIAKRIKELVREDTGIQVKGENGYQRARYKDIVILLRTMSGWADIFSETLMAEGIPSYSDTQTGYFSALEVKTVLNLLKVIDNPRQDIPLTAVLRSPMAGFSDEELAFMREANREKDMYDAIVLYEQEGGDEGIRQKLSSFLKQVEEFRQMVPYTTIQDLIVQVLEKTGYYAYVSVMPGGNRRSGNLDMLMQKAIEFEASSYKGLFHFNRYIEKLHKYDIDFGEAGVSNENENAVRIMSIHKSKGLEFPIVFASGFGKSFNNQDARSKLVLHPDLGIAPDYVDYHLRVKSPTLIKKVIQKKTVLENLGEELRILYVALTRAKEKLILTGSIKDLTKKMEKWQETSLLNQGKMMFQTLSTASNFLDWVMPAVLDEEQLKKEGIDFVMNSVNLSDLTKSEILSQIKKEWKKENLLTWNTDDVYNQELHDELNKRLSFSYPFEGEGLLPAKLSVSELKRLSQKVEEEPGEELFQKEKETEAYVPNFIKAEQPVTGTDRGTLYHKVVECLGFEKMTSETEVSLQIEKMISEGKIREEDKKTIDVKKIYEFSLSPLANRMADSKMQGKLFREQPFVFGVPANRINPEVKSEEVVLVQGIIDAYFEEGDELVLVDYKTDRMEKEEVLKDRYKTQFDYYKEALERLTHKRVKECYIYSFHFGKEILLS